MKVLYVFQSDPTRASAQSGRPSGIYRQMVAHGDDVDLLILDDRIFRSLILLHKAVGRIFRVSNGMRGALPMLYASWRIRRAAKRLNPDVIFSPSTVLFRYLDGLSCIKVACCDTLVPGLYRYYPDQTRKGSYAADVRVERCCLERMDVLLVPTFWCADQARAIAPTKAPQIVVHPFGANSVRGAKKLDSGVREFAPLRISHGGIKITTVVSDWRRKGGATTLRICQGLRDKGWKVHLQIIGVLTDDARREVDDADISAEFIGRLDRERFEDAERFDELLLGSTFFCMPSTGEAFGMAVCEAMEFGVPCVVTNNGGIGELVEHGETGFLLRNSEDVPLVIDRMDEVLRSPEKYMKMVDAAVDAFAVKFNWESFYRSTFAKIVSTSKPRSGRGACVG